MLGACTGNSDTSSLLVLSSTINFAMARAPRRRRASHNTVLSNSSTTSSSLPFQNVVDDLTTSRKFTSPNSASEAINQIDARPHLEGTAPANGFARTRNSVLSALAQTTIPAWATTVVMVSLIFGGCCTNVRQILFSTLLAPQGHTASDAA